MEILTRKEVSAVLRMSPQALSNHVSRRNWSAVPCPIKIGGRNKWLREDVFDFLLEKQNESREKLARVRGRPRKRQ